MQYYTIENFRNNAYFCIHYTKFEGCSNYNCIKEKTIQEYMAPSINFSDEYITQYSIDNLLDYLFSPQNSYCINCQWKNDEIIKKGIQNILKFLTI